MLADEFCCGAEGDAYVGIAPQDINLETLLSRVQIDYAPGIAEAHWQNIRRTIGICHAYKTDITGIDYGFHFFPSGVYNRFHIICLFRLKSFQAFVY
jgi:hypothetical protein